MQRTISSLAASACFLALLGAAAPAHAAFATFVSPAGDNTNNCTSPATACGSLAGAFAKTDPGGVMHVLPGDYPTLVIDKAIEIVADGGQASISGSTTSDGSTQAALIVSAGPTDDVRIRGFTFDRHGSISGGGIGFVTGGALYVENCTIVNAGANPGLIFVPSGASQLYVTNSVMSDNGSGGAAGGGILIAPTGSGSADAVLDNVRVENNRRGILIDGRSTSGSNNITLRNSTIAGSPEFGLNAIDSGGGSTDVMIEGSTVSNNGTQGVVSNGTKTTVRMRNSTATGNSRGILFTASGKLISGGGNLVTGNTVNGAFSSSVAQQ